MDSHERLQKKQISFGYKGHEKKRIGGGKNWRRKREKSCFGDLFSVLSRGSKKGQRGRLFLSLVLVKVGESLGKSL